MKIYGLDFGTSNSAIAIQQDSDVNLINFTNTDQKSDRSIIFFPEYGGKNHFIGTEAVLEYFSSGMKGRLIQSVKSILKDKNFKNTVINRNIISPEELISFLLRGLKRKADKKIGEEVDNVLLGRPVFFSEKDPEVDRIAEQRLKDAAHLAGFKNIAFMLEPLAAAYTYERSLTKPELCFIADFGAGTSDFTIAHLDSKKSNIIDRQSDILSKGGIYIGGDNFDSNIMWEKLVEYFGSNSEYEGALPGKMLSMPSSIYRLLCSWEKVSFLKGMRQQQSFKNYLYGSTDKDAISRLIHLVNNNLSFSLFEKIEQAKHILSNEDNASINFLNDIIDINQKITRIEFESIISDEVLQIKRSINYVLQEAGVKPKDIKSVFLTGGTSQIPMIYSIFTSIFGNEKIQTGSTFNSVALGLATRAPLMF